MNRTVRGPRASISRRSLLQFAGFGAGAVGLLSLSSCSSGRTASTPLVWANWTLSLDFDEETQTFPTLDRFIEESGVSVDYLEDIDDSASFYATIREQLQQDQFPGYDMFNFADDFTARLIANGEVQEIDHSGIPNFANVSALMRDPAYDPGRRFSMPWQGGMTGLCYNTKLYPKGVRSMADLTSPELRGRVSVLTEMIDTIGLTMLEQGVDPSGMWGEAEFNAALAEVEERLRNGQYAQVKGNSYTQDLQSGDIWVAMCWSGDVQVLNDEAGEELFAFVIPEEGATKYVNSILVPNGTDRMSDIVQLIDYYYRPEVAAEVIAYTCTMPPVDGAQKELAKIDPRLAESPMLFPTEEDAQRIYDFRQLDSQKTKQYVAAFSKVLGL